MIASTRVEVRRGKNESSTALIRRFTKKAQRLGLVHEMRDRRYFERARSKNIVHKRALISRARRETFNELVKLGKIDLSSKKIRKGGRK